MPLPQWLARFNRVGTNTVTRPLASRLPWFAVVVHRGRRSGRLYRTPVNAFRRGDHFVFALTYGPDRDWVKNTLAAGECQLETRGQRFRVGQPYLFTDPHGDRLPAVVRFVLRIIGVTEFLQLRVL
jgi:deazaflavin-dependent oxidoreductase (nitroreductase family)